MSTNTNTFRNIATILEEAAAEHAANNAAKAAISNADQILGVRTTVSNDGIWEQDFTDYGPSSKLEELTVPVPGTDNSILVIVNTASVFINPNGKRHQIKYFDWLEARGALSFIGSLKHDDYLRAEVGFYVKNLTPAQVNAPLTKNVMYITHRCANPSFSHLAPKVGVQAMNLKNGQLVKGYYYESAESLKFEKGEPEWKERARATFAKYMAADAIMLGHRVMSSPSVWVGAGASKEEKRQAKVNYIASVVDGWHLDRHEFAQKMQVVGALKNAARHTARIHSKLESGELRFAEGVDLAKLNFKLGNEVVKAIDLMGIVIQVFVCGTPFGTPVKVNDNNIAHIIAQATKVRDIEFVRVEG